MRRLFIVLLCSISPVLFSEVLTIGPGKAYSNLRDAAGVANAGDTLLFSAGVYNGGQSIASLQGEQNAWITILADQAGGVIIRGSSSAWHFQDAAYVRIKGIIFEQQTGNGVNVDDGGSYSTPAHDILFQDCIFRDMNASGNNDLLKLSGVDRFSILNCVFQNGASGGSGVDMVGCHDGEIIGNRFENLGSNAIQTKGGSQSVAIQGNWFENGGHRAINIGGSTGLPYFRPESATFEAAEIRVYANVFIGSMAPIAFVGCTECEVINNTIIDPEKWVVRILQETVDPDRFVSCGNNRFLNNLIYLGNISTETNIGSNTAPETFVYDGNFWYNYDNQNWNGPRIPVDDVNQRINQNPQFVDYAGENFELKSGSPAAGILDYTGSPEVDYYENSYNSPRSAGAFEIPGETAVKSSPIRKMSKNSSVSVFPNPTNSKSVIQFDLSEEKFIELAIYDVRGKLLRVLESDYRTPGTHRLNWDGKTGLGNRVSSGLYFCRLQVGSDSVVRKISILN